MKKFLLIMALIVPMIAFTGCGGDDDEPQVNITESDIVGTWTVTQMSQGSETVDVPNGYVVFNLKSDHNYTVRFLDNNYIGTWKLEGNTVVGTTLDPITERLTFISLNGNTATINYSNSEGDNYTLKAIKSGGNSGLITQEELENAPSFIYNYSDGGVLYIKFREGHIYTKEVTKDGMVMNQDDIIYTISGENITMEMGWQKTKGTINKVKFNNGNIGIVMNFEGSFGIATWLSKTFKWDSNTFEQTI